MLTPLLDIDVASIYKNKLGDLVPLPTRMARATPDMADAISHIAQQLSKLGGKLALSDLFRSYDMQLQAHLDYVTKKKSAYSPPPGGSFHEAGRAMDIALGEISIGLDEFWSFCKKFGVVPIIKKPNIKQKEAWHFECRGSHQLVIDYYKARKGDNFEDPYAAGAASAILSIGQHVEKFGTKQKEARLQSALIRLGKDIGNIDGEVGAKTSAALTELHIDGSWDEMIQIVEDLIQMTFPAEHRASRATNVISDGPFSWAAPSHIAA